MGCGPSTQKTVESTKPKSKPDSDSVSPSNDALFVGSKVNIPSIVIREPSICGTQPSRSLFNGDGA